MSESASTSSMREEGTMTFLEHLQELRTTLVRCGLAIVAGMCVCLAITPQLMAALRAPAARAIEKFSAENGGWIDKSIDEFLVVPEAVGGIMLWFKVSFWGGLTLAMPLVLYFIGLFIFPGLHEKEKKAVRMGAGVGALLFFAGVALAYFFSIQLFMQVELKIGAWLGTKPDFKFLGDYIKVALKVLLAFGLAFELPLIVYLLGYLGIVDTNDLRAKRKHVFVGILIMAMFLTPPDVGTQLILAGPLYLMYEATILLVQLKEKKEADALSA